MLLDQPATISLFTDNLHDMMPTSAKIFLSRLRQTVEQCLADPELNVGHLTRKMFMSRTDLHRKIKDTTGLSTTAYVRQMRLERAAKLLLTCPECSIEQIARKTGFNDSSYFTRRFKEVFGVCPATYRRCHGNLEHMS